MYREYCQYVGCSIYKQYNNEIDERTATIAII